MYCPNCGKEIDDQGAFCPECGAPTNSQSPAPPAPAAFIYDPQISDGYSSQPAPQDGYEFAPPQAPSVEPQFAPPVGPPAGAPIEPQYAPLTGPPPEQQYAPPQTATQQPQYAPPAGPPPEQQFAPPQPAPQQSQYAQPYAPQAQAPAPPPKKKSKLPIIIVAIVLVIALGIGGGVAIYSINKANRYEAVVVTYEEAGSNLQHASSRRDYEDAKELFQTAILGFEEFGDYKDAIHLISVCDTKIQECDQNIDYIDANALFDDGEYAAAQRAFEALGYFRDSVAMAELCAKYLRFEDAQAVFDSGDFNEALNLFNDLVNEDFFEAEEWVPKTRYAIADAYSAAGEHYEAWKIFTALGDYSDSAYRASAQISSYPGTGELYHNGGYVSSAVHLVFDGANLTEVRYIKIYSDGNLVSTVFINIYSSTTIYLPSGTYTIKVAFGDNWFGEEVMFGDEGFYATMTFDGGSTSTYFAYNYIYTLTMMVSEDDANVGAEQTNRNDF